MRLVFVLMMNGFLCVLLFNSSPANCNYYNTFDQENGDNSIDEVECSIEQPRSISEVMKDVVVYVEYRSGTENRTIGIKDAIANLGAKVNDKLLR